MNISEVHLTFNQPFEEDSLKKTAGKIIRFLLEYSLFLIGGSIIALIWANTDHVSYEHFKHSVHFWVNDVAMALFFALAAKEIREATLPGGALHSPKKAALPLLATIGGMAGPAILYIAGCYFWGADKLLNGWAIPCATDIAFSYLVARVIFGSKHVAIPFLLLLAIADDALGLIILATCYPTGNMDMSMFVILVGIALVISWRLYKANVQNFWWYLLPGVISWFGFHQGGIHPALSLVPIVFFMPHAAKDIGPFDEREAHRPNALDNFATWWEHPVEVILGAFGLVNAGVIFSNMGTATYLVVLALLAGKPLGIYLFSKIGTLFGLQLPHGMKMKDVFTLGVTAGIGFTVALFVATVAFDAGPDLEAAKMGALFSFAVAPIAIIVGKILGVKRKI